MPDNSQPFTRIKRIVPLPGQTSVEIETSISFATDALALAFVQGLIDQGALPAGDGSGTPGDKGPDGDKGEAGDKGETGDKGPDGDPGGVEWGFITGAITDQPDLAAALDDLAGGIAVLQPADATLTALSGNAEVLKLNVAGADIPSSATPDIGAATGEAVNMTGTTGITGFVAAAAGIMRWITFAGSLTLTNSASLLLPGGKNVITQAGDVFGFISIPAGWRCFSITRASGEVVLPLTSTATGYNWDPAFVPVLVVTTSGVTITISNASTRANHVGVIRNASSGTITLAVASGTISICGDGGLVSQSLPRGQSYTFIADSTVWRAIAGVQYPRQIAANHLTGQTATVANVLVANIPNDGFPHTAVLQVYARVTARTTNTLQINAQWVDESVTSATQPIFPMGQTTAPMAAVQVFIFPAITLRMFPGQNLIVSTSFPTTGGTITYDIGAVLTQID